MLGQLQESFDSLEQGSRRMLAQVSIFGTLNTFVSSSHGTVQDFGGSTNSEAMVWVVRRRLHSKLCDVYNSLLIATVQTYATRMFSPSNIFRALIFALGAADQLPYWSNLQ